MLFAFSGFNLLHHHHINLVAVVAHMPWLLAAADVMIVDDRPRAQSLAGGLALILASELLIGFPQAVLWTGLALAAYAVYRASEWRRWRRLRTCAAALAIGILMGAVQWLPSLDVAGRSTRVGHPTSFALTYSLHPWNLLQFWSPYFFEGGAYGGIGTFHEYGTYWVPS